MKEIQKKGVSLVFADAIKRLGTWDTFLQSQLWGYKVVRKMPLGPEPTVYYSEQQCTCVYVCVCNI